MGTAASQTSSNGETAEESDSPQAITNDSIRELLPAGGEERKNQVVPTLFQWPYGGSAVYIAGSFNDWGGKVPMKESQGANGDATPVFTITLDLLPGRHYYKFIVDDQWQYDPAKDRMINHQGIVNNVIEVKASRPESLPALSPLDRVMGDPESYGQETPKEFTADPPPLPPQLGNLTHLNPTQIQGTKTDSNATFGTTERETRTQPIPLHVTLNHVCFRRPEQESIISTDGKLVVIGVTQRYKAKGLQHSKDRLVTTIYYKPIEST
mmetsp:Transcript_14447/g.23548  ORF Transcript_14447/g.23548 Transcript_14447/m.23548 type:complete len:267 (-) Transcript_14447:164-964(-)